MNCDYDKKDFMVGHILFECYKYCQGHTCKECVKRKEALVNLN